MEGIHKYSSVGGGTTQKSFMQDTKAVYNFFLQDHREHLLAGFGQWEFLGLLGPRTQGEARAVHVAFMEKWDFEDLENPDLDQPWFGRLSFFILRLLPLPLPLCVLKCNSSQCGP